MAVPACCPRGGGGSRGRLPPVRGTSARPAVRRTGSPPAVVTAPRLSAGKDVSQSWFQEQGETDFHGLSAGSTLGVEKNVMILGKIIFHPHKES